MKKLILFSFNWLRRAGHQGAGSRLPQLLTLLTFGLLLLSRPARAQFPINEAFTGPTTPSFTLGAGGTSAAAQLTGTATVPGYLRLTNNTTNQAGYATLNSSFASPAGFSISFEFFSFNAAVGSTSSTTTGADGISVFLLDANGTDPRIPGQFTIGAFGGSLGYAQKTAVSGAVTTDVPGVSKGYLGIGLDEFGNYSNPTEGRILGTGFVPEAVALRGPGTGITGYEYLTGTKTLPFPLSFPASLTEASATSADYRKAYIFVIPVAGGGYNVTVRIQRGPSTVVTTTFNYPIANPPANLRVGFAASTGGGTNFHEIRNLAIVQTPIAADDRAQTRYQVPVTITVLANDKAFGTTLNKASVNLDPSTTIITNSFTVAGKGTFAVDANGLVTFTPDPSFAGVVSIPYTVNDLLGNTSNPAAITVTVTGADVATSVSGPASANPGSQVTYTVNTTNIGAETATNLSPTLLLPTGLSIPTSPGYTYNTTSGLVTFTAVTLARNGTTTNSVTFNVPTTGTSSITATSNYTYGANPVVPDPVPANNSATLTTAITGLATVSTDCATPGKDGPGSLSSVAGPNTYYPGVSVSTANGVSTVTVGPPAPAGASPLAVNDLVLLMQMQGASIDTNPLAVTYGTVSGSTAGQYEYAVVASVSGTTVTLNKPLTKTYTTTTTAPAQNFQLIRVPQYSSLTVTGIVTGAAWDSRAKTGGVLALDVAGVTTFIGTAPGLSMSAHGFSGGGGVSYGGTAVATNTPSIYATPTTLTAHGAKGEGIAGTPRFYYQGTAVATTTVEGYAPGDNNIGAPATGGGGAQDFTPLDNSGNSGGGGGANLSAGGIGGFGAGSNAFIPGRPGTGNQAVGGRGLTNGGATTLLMGGGGGAGSPMALMAPAH